jgi:hypothetical protein
MKYKDIRANDIGGAVDIKDAKHLSLATQGAIVCDDTPCVQLDNLSSSAGVRIGYVYDKGAGSDWKLGVIYLPIGTAKTASSYRDFKLAGSELGTFSTPNLTATCTATYYELVRLWLSADNIATLTHATYIKCDTTKTSTTVMALKKGENSFLIKMDAGETALTIALTTADASGQGSVYEITELDRSEIARLY